MLGLLFLLFGVLSIAGFIVGIVIDNLWYFIMIFTQIIFFSFMLALIFIFDDKEVVVKYDPNNQNLTVTLVCYKQIFINYQILLYIIQIRNIVSRLFCKDKEITRSFNIKDIESILTTPGCCLNKFYVSGINSISVLTDAMFKTG